jgi:hypothetical protein
MTFMNDEYPVWVAADGTEWTQESLWDHCEFDRNSFPFGGCRNTVEYVGVRGNVRIQLCAAHFAKIEHTACAGTKFDRLNPPNGNSIITTESA